MKKSEQIAGIVSIAAIIFLVFYVFKLKLISIEDERTMYVAGALIGVSLLAIISHYLTIGFILKRRVAAFKDLAKKYSLEHYFVSNIFFIPYGKLNSIKGNINNHTIEISDESFIPKTDKLAEDIAISSVVAYTPRKSYSMSTKIFLDGKSETRDYSQKWIIYRNPFMKVSEVESYLSELASK